MKDKTFFHLRPALPRKVKCINCRHLNLKEMRCYPQDSDAAPYYELSKKDIRKPDYCDFFDKK